MAITSRHDLREEMWSIWTEYDPYRNWTRSVFDHLVEAQHTSVADDPQLWTVADDIATEITKLAASVPLPYNETISIESIPAPTGIVSVPSCIPSRFRVQVVDSRDSDYEPDEIPMMFHALSWVLLDTEVAEEKLLFVYPWCYTSLVTGLGANRDVFPLSPQGSMVGARFQIDGVDDPAALWHDDYYELVRWLLALFAWSAEEATTGTTAIGRQQRRQRARKGLHEQMVRTIKLRRHSRSGEGSEGTGTEVSPHWRRGHWRNQRVGPGRSQSRLVWVRSHIVHRDRVADPESLRPTTTVRQVDRV
jgi:hypothetical protein